MFIVLVSACVLALGIVNLDCLMIFKFAFLSVSCIFVGLQCFWYYWLGERKGIRPVKCTATQCSWLTMAAWCSILSLHQEHTHYHRRDACLKAEVKAALATIRVFLTCLCSMLFLVRNTVVLQCFFVFFIQWFGCFSSIWVYLMVALLYYIQLFKPSAKLQIFLALY